MLTCHSDGRSGEELHRREGKPADGNGRRNARPAIRTQRTKLQAALLSGVAPGTIHLGKKLVQMTDRGPGEGIFLRFEDGTSTLADVVVGADGIRSVCAFRLHAPLFFSIFFPAILYFTILSSLLTLVVNVYR